MLETKNMTMDELFTMGDVDAFLAKAREKAEARIRGKKFAGMETEDVVQEVMIKIFRSLDKYDGSRAKPSTFIVNIIDNMVKDCYRKCLTNKNLSVVNAVEIVDTYDDEMGESNNLAHIGEEDPEYVHSEFFTDIMENIGLNDREKEVFRYRVFGLSFKEISEKIGVTDARVSQLWKGVREKYFLSIK